MKAYYVVGVLEEIAGKPMIFFTYRASPTVYELKNKKNPSYDYRD